ncbi:MAG: helix-turn-helix domain-containing protein [Clostridiales bacterium]|nr:helix-turn-helix domain-containing protein [Clostridiales bacterium]
MKQLLNTSDMRKALKIGRTKLYEMINQGALPVIKIGNRYYIPEDKLDRFISSSVGKKL